MKIPPLPKEVLDYIETLAPASQNNSRAIVRAACRKILTENTPNEAARIINQKYGLSLPVDNSEYDNPPF